LNKDEKKQEIKSLRISSLLLEKLRNEAEAGKSSLNSLIVSILEDYENWNRFSSEFHYVSLSSETLRTLIGRLDDKEVISMAKEKGAVFHREIMMYWFKRVDLDSFISYLRLADKYQKIATTTLLKDETANVLTILLHHDLGEKWSLFTEHYFGEAIRVNFPSIQQQVERTSNLVSFKLALN